MSILLGREPAILPEPLDVLALLAAILARMLDIHIHVAVVAWQRTATDDWAACAADVSRRYT